MRSWELGQRHWQHFDNSFSTTSHSSTRDRQRQKAPIVMSMNSPRKSPESDRRPKAVVIQPSSPRYPLSACATPTAGAHRRIGIAVDLSDESAFAVQWAVQNYLRKGDAVILLHVRPTSVLYGADWGSVDLSLAEADEESQRKMEDEFDAFTHSKSNELAQPLVAAGVPCKIHIVKDHDMKERLCLEVERLGLSTVVMGSRGFGASRRNTKGRLGSVSDYCVQHCVCPVVVVRFPDDKDGDADGDGGQESAVCGGGKVLNAAEDKQESVDESDKQTQTEPRKSS